MFVIEVIPLASGLPGGTLTYRSSSDIPVGSLASVPLRKKQITAIVVASTPAIEAKASLKRAGFMLRGASLRSLGRIPESIMDAAREVAILQATTVGSVLSSLFVEAMPSELPDALAEGTGYEESGIEDIYEKRIEAYRKIVNKGMREKRTTLIVVPTLIEAERLSSRFASVTPLLLIGTVRAKQREAALAAAASAEGLVIATPSFAWIPIQNLGSIVIERASANGYALPKRPYLDVRSACAALAKHRDIPIRYGDLPLPLELRAKPSAKITAGLPSTATLLDVSGKLDRSVPFRAVPEAMVEAVRACVARKGRAAILAARKGYASAVVCRDCGNTLRDARGQALSLVITGKSRILRSADGETKRDANAVCDVCGSWNLLPLGIGVERVVEELRAVMPQADIVRFDTEAIRTSAQAAAARKRFEAPGAIAVGTEAMLPYLDPAKPIEFAAIASADSLLALPFWRARERVVRIGLTLRERAKDVLIATRLPEEIAFSAVLHPAKTKFFEEESSMREALSYPPYGYLLAFHAEGSKSQLDAAAKLITEALAPHASVRLLDRPALRGRFRLSIIAKLKRDAWPDTKLSERLAHLPPSITTLINPESLW